MSSEFQIFAPLNLNDLCPAAEVYKGICNRSQLRVLLFQFLPGKYQQKKLPILSHGGYMCMFGDNNPTEVERVFVQEETKHLS